MAVAKKGSFWSGDSLPARGARRWPLSYFLTALLVIILIPQVCVKVKQQAQAIKRITSLFGDNLNPTPWHWHDNQRGPQNRTWERSLEILKCSYPGWAKPSLKAEVLDDEIRECPAYFQYIKEDLAPWSRTGITATNIQMAKEHAAFKVIILKGRLYVDLYYSCVQTRAVFTVWGLLMLLEKYEDEIPDVEIMFDCMDRPHISKSEGYEAIKADESWSPAPLFRYCSNSRHYDIPWPDWSFWGWAETQLQPWEQELEKIIKGSRKKAWRFKEPKAYWRGNPHVASPLRMELLRCNNETRQPKSEIRVQDWMTEYATGKQHSKLEDQCDYRYKIYSEGFAWSVSFKYIMACGSPTLAISPKYYDFFMRGLVPGVHYIQVRPAQICAHNLCPAIDREVKFGENDLLKAIRIGEAGQDFVTNEVGMPNVYDYMFHMLRAYADLQRFKPSVPRTAKEATQDFILCLAQPHERLLLEEARRNVQWSTPSCLLPEEPKTGAFPAAYKNHGWLAPEHDDEFWIDRDCEPLRPPKNFGRSLVRRGGVTGHADAKTTNITRNDRGAPERWEQHSGRNVAPDALTNIPTTQTQNAAEHDSRHGREQRLPTATRNASVVVVAPKVVLNTDARRSTSPVYSSSAAHHRSPRAKRGRHDDVVVTQNTSTTESADPREARAN